MGGKSKEYMWKRKVRSLERRYEKTRQNWRRWGESMAAGVAGVSVGRSSDEFTQLVSKNGGLINVNSTGNKYEVSGDYPVMRRRGGMLVKEYADLPTKSFKTRKGAENYAKSLMKKYWSGRSRSK